MQNRRLVSGVLLAALIALVGTTAGAQFGHLKIPKAPSLPSSPVKAPKHTFKCSEIDDAMVDRFLKGRNARKKAEESEAMKASQNQAGGTDAEAKEAASDAAQSTAAAANLPFGNNSRGTSKADKAERDASGLDDIRLAGFVECCIGVLHDEAQVLSQTPQSSMEAILKREGELSKECR